MRVSATIVRRLLPLALAALPAQAQKLPAEVSVCFVPGEQCAVRIVAVIATARSEVRVQAYGFSAPPIRN